jgi:hypothetical protein
MARYDATKEKFSLVTVLGKPALFHDCRIDRDTVPKGWHLYEVRSDDDGLGDPVQIAKGIMVNHWGTILTQKPIKLPPDSYLDIDPEKDWDYGSGGGFTIKEYEKAFPKKNKDMER